LKYSIHCQECGYDYSSPKVTHCIKCGSGQLQAKSDPTEVRKQRDLRMIRSELPWPGGEILPVSKALDPKKGLHIPEMGVMVKGRGSTVIFTNMWDLIEDPSKADSANAKSYPTYEAIIEDGWRVD
jgi:hypothetical protein